MVYLNVNGIEWEIAVPDMTLDALPPVEHQAKIYTWLYHRDDAMKLFGFAEPQERSLFLDLQKVEGIGPKAALKILSHIALREFIEILEAGDVSKLEKIPGIGKKSAAKMLLALKGKLSLSGECPAVSENRDSAWEDVVSALVQMGYDRRSCEEAVKKLEKNLDTSASRNAQEEQLFRLAIVELAV
ncbi:MAG: Holliday junction branch migration protein RuvA [Bacteroides sp.]|nr:Holliday junction branch migration protein RuvA [Prevotella sp.]MCM1407243.1 Holliday junction branch migration protein RuvA [Treponema brennaborense]MCM1469731.1 Holliday junction branch migration protein RuvA [Bacteroides sp.]